MADMVGTELYTGAELAGAAIFAAGAASALTTNEQRTTTGCATHGCSGEGRYLFHGQRACSRGCLELLLRAAVIEEQARSTAAALRARPRVLLGRILIEQGTINEVQLEHALRSQRATGAGRLGCWLKQQVELPEADFTAALSIQWRCPVFRFGNFAPARMASYLPRPLMEAHGALPLRLTESPERLSLCFEDHVDYELLSATERMHGVSADAGLLTATEFWQATRDLLGVRFPRIQEVEASSPDTMVEAMGRLLIASGAQDARMVAVHGCYWLRLWTSPSPSHANGMIAPEPVAWDILCTPRTGSNFNSDFSDTQSDESARTVEHLTAAMLCVLR
jgi:hypothetical protein